MNWRFFSLTTRCRYRKVLELYSRNNQVFRGNILSLMVSHNFHSKGIVCDEHHVSIKTCGSLYEKWRKEKKFWSIPENELTLKVKYIDTFKDSVDNLNASSPVILALHGAPGSCQDFCHLASHLHPRGMRVISPSFPDFSQLKPGVFRHSDEEKAEFVKDFLKEIKVFKIDALVVHSSAVYPGLILCLEDNEIVMKSFVMLNTGTCKTDTPVSRHLTRMQMMTKASEISVLFRIMEPFAPMIMKILKIPVKTNNFLDPLLSSFAIVHANAAKAEEKFLSLLKKRFPILYAFSENDKLVDKHDSYEVANLLGADYQDIFIFDKDGNLKKDGYETSTLRVMVFESGSHYAFKKYPNIINEAIAQFIEKNKNIQGSKL